MASRTMIATQDPKALPERVVVTSLVGTAAEVARDLERLPSGSALVEIRADRLHAGEVAALVARAPRPVLVTARRIRDGGCFEGSEVERGELIQSGLRAGAALADVEWDSPLIELARGPDRDRIVASHHGGSCERTALQARYAELSATGARRLKLVPRARRVADGVALRDLLARARRDGHDLAAFASGAPGLPTRVYATSWGSWATFGALARGRETAAGQPTSRDLLDVWRALDIGATTRRFGLVGSPVLSSPSPAAHAAGYRSLGLDACFVPFETEDLDDALSLCGPRGPEPAVALGVTIPLKEIAAARAVAGDEVVAESGTANTIIASTSGYVARNTDAPAAMRIVRERIDPRGRVAAVVGAGGTARALAVALRLAGAEVVLYNRTGSRAERAARECRVSWRPLSELETARWDILVNATPLGREGEISVRPRFLTGRLVIDVAYGREPTPLATDARERGLDVVDGLTFLAAQAALQFELMTGSRIEPATLETAARAWLGDSLGSSSQPLDASSPRS